MQWRRIHSLAVSQPARALTNAKPLTKRLSVRKLDSSLANVHLCMRMFAPLGSKSFVGGLGRLDEPCLSKGWALVHGRDLGAESIVKTTKYARHGGS
ncbi:BQ5605_C015g07771 [Microbotryum silenes-dioicae]|uniref:BQ5605_C015g07771 protein n=1 Tax=Microbotryum silenes-dioicae TaxID=796604 RepID=A0A2X0NQI4_9BASI|nr:BQ5605_C015g07771 [Microbotryum silenes-dioicae]